MFKFFFILFFTLSLFFGYLIIIAKNPINALLSLISCFFFSSLILCCFQLTFFAIIFITIYIGAIAVFFLFIIMFINIKKTKIYQQNFILFLFIFIIYFLFINIFKLKFNYFFFNFDILNLILQTQSLEILAFFLFDYSFFFLFYIGFLLLITMLGTLLLLKI